MPKLERILYPTDFSDDAAYAIDYITLLAAQFKAAVHVVHVMQEPVFMVPDGALATGLPPANFPDIQAAEEEQLARVAAQFTGMQVTQRTLVGPPAEEIVREAQDSGADLIVMATHGHTGFAHVLLGSTAERVVRHAGCPVLTIRPPHRPKA